MRRSGQGKIGNGKMLRLHDHPRLRFLWRSQRSPCPTGLPAPSSSSRQEIVVEGKKLEPVIQHFISSMTQGRPTDQLGRWKQEICPTIFGIDPAQASFMEDRIVALANEVGLRKGGNHCTTSLAIIVTANPGNFAYRLARRYPTTLSTDGYSRLVSFVDTTNPVRWITISDECGGGCGLPNSRITKPTAPTFINMIIVVDANRLSGYSLGELSDYVALVGLTNPPVQAARPPNSIMSMFDAAQPANSSFELTGLCASSSAI